MNVGCINSEHRASKGGTVLNHTDDILSLCLYDLQSNYLVTKSAFAAMNIEVKMIQFHYLQPDRCILMSSEKMLAKKNLVSLLN